MTREDKIDIVIVNLFRNILWISDKKILLQIHNSLKSKNIVTKERILNDIYNNSNKHKKILKDIDFQINIATNKLSEVNDSFAEKKEIINLFN